LLSKIDMTSAMTVSEIDPALPVPLLSDGRTARKAKRQRESAREEAAKREQPSLCLDRRGPVCALLRRYREQRAVDVAAVPSPLDAWLPRLRREVEALEAWASSRGRRHRLDGATIRQALHFLRAFGRIMALDFSSIPIEERESLVALLALEHRWCYAAAGTTREAFKIAIGRTGAR
jgi:hypothetical protein